MLLGAYSFLLKSKLNMHLLIILCGGFSTLHGGTGLTVAVTSSVIGAGPGGGTGAKHARPLPPDQS